MRWNTFLFGSLFSFKKMLVLFLIFFPLSSFFFFLLISRNFKALLDNNPLLIWGADYLLPVCDFIFHFLSNISIFLVLL